MATKTLRNVTSYEDLRDVQLGRVRDAIRRNRGPIDWKQAHFAMWGDARDPRDARRDNETILEWIAAGRLTQTWDDDGHSFIGA